MKLVDNDFMHNIFECTQEEFDQIPKEWLNKSCEQCVCANGDEEKFLKKFGIVDEDLYSDYFKFIIVG